METAPVSGTNILNSEAARRKLRRMAFQIAESNADEGALVVAGIEGNGVLLAQKLVAELKDILQIPIRFITVQLDKKQFLQVTLSENRKEASCRCGNDENFSSTFCFFPIPFLVW